MKPLLNLMMAVLLIAAVIATFFYHWDLAEGARFERFTTPLSAPPQARSLNPSPPIVLPAR